MQAWSHQSNPSAPSSNATSTSSEVPVFVETLEYKRFVEFCEACRRDRYIGLCYWPPGVGKTLSARHYTPCDRIEAAHPRWESLSRVVPTDVADCHTVFYTPPVANTPRGIEAAVEGRCAM